MRRSDCRLRLLLEVRQRCPDDLATFENLAGAEAGPTNSDQTVPVVPVGPLRIDLVRDGIAGRQAKLQRNAFARRLFEALPEQVFACLIVLLPEGRELRVPVLFQTSYPTVLLEPFTVDPTIAATMVRLSLQGNS